MEEKEIENWVIPFDEELLTKLDLGEQHIFLFHRDLMLLPLYVVVVGKEKPTKKDVHHIRECGDNVLPIGLGSEGIEIMRECLKNPDTGRVPVYTFNEGIRVAFLIKKEVADSSQP